VQKEEDIEKAQISISSIVESAVTEAKASSMK
jgi:hypothetical protein